MNSLTTVLAIDTSCDDTAAAVVQGTTILSNIIASQTQLHKPYGGVFPTVAKQAHKENIAPVVALALKRARVQWSEIEAIAVTQGPGLAPALEVGIAYAKELANQHNLPLIPVNHLEGHLLSVLAQPQRRSKKLTSTQPQFPALGLVISGGHSLFVLIKDIGEYEILGSTIDDAAGEALDKIGRMLGLGYPAGPVIEVFAHHGNPRAYEFPLPMTTSGDFNVSFSGMKTFARNLITKLTEKNRSLTKQEIYDFAASIQYAIFRHIMYKLSKILLKHEVEEIWLGGGVAANITLRKTLRQTAKPLRVRVPYTKRLTQDNAAMIGLVAALKLQQGLVFSTENLERKPKFPLV